MTPLVRTVRALTGVEFAAPEDAAGVELTEWGAVGPRYRAPWRDTTGAAAWERAFLENLLPEREFESDARTFDARTIENVASRRARIAALHPATPVGVAQWLARGWAWVVETEALLAALRAGLEFWQAPARRRPLTWRRGPRMASFSLWNPWAEFFPSALRTAYGWEKSAALPSTRREAAAWVEAWTPRTATEPPPPLAAGVRLEALGVPPDEITISAHEFAATYPRAVA